MVVRKNCLICEKEIFRSNWKRTTKERRGKNAVTCSRPCARTYERVCNYIYRRIRQKLKQKNEKHN